MIDRGKTWKCRRCGKVKPDAEFHRSSRLLSGHLSHCADCANREHRACNEKYKARYRARQAVFEQNHRAEINARVRGARVARPHIFAAMRTREKNTISYATSQIVLRTGLQRKHIPEALAAAKLTHLQIKRHLKGLP